MITLSAEKTVVAGGCLLSEEEAQKRGIDVAAARTNTLSARILAAHNKGASEDRLEISFDALASHDITYVGIIQTARAAGLEKFPVPYVLTNCHNSLCAVGGTINEDDHAFGLLAAKKYGGIYVPPHLAVIHQYMREMMAKCGSMILGSDSHTRYGALGAMGVGEGGPELVKQLLGRTWDIDRPEVVAVWLEGEPRQGIGPQDVALAIIGAVYKNGFVKNRIMEFMGPGVAGLSMDFRSGIDVMTTETACLSSIWITDDNVRKWLELHGRGQDYRELKLDAPAAYEGVVKVDLGAVESMIALPFHPSNTHTIKEFNAHARELLAEVDCEAAKLFGAAGKQLNLAGKIKDGGVIASQGIVGGCSGGTFENITWASAILGDWSQANPEFTLSLYPASVPVAAQLVNNGATEKLMSLGAIVKTSFCGPCFGAGDTPAHGALSIRHVTRNFPNREGSKPGEGQISAVALMDARSIAASAANGGRITAATEMDWKWPGMKANLEYRFNPVTYTKRVYNGFGQPKPDTQLIFGPNIADWPVLEPMPEHLVLRVASVILDDVTTTDELIPSGETSSLRSNPEKLAEYTLSRKDPGYVARARAMREMERERLRDPQNAELLAKIGDVIKACDKQPVKYQIWDEADPLKYIGLGSVIFARKPGDGSAREQAASCQKILGGWANLAEEYATKRYRSNLINWGIIPFIVAHDLGRELKVGDYIVIPHIRSRIFAGEPSALAALVHENEDKSKVWGDQITLNMEKLSQQEREILLVGCLVNYYRNKK